SFHHAGWNLRSGAELLDFGWRDDGDRFRCRDASSAASRAITLGPLAPPPRRHGPSWPLVLVLPGVLAAWPLAVPVVQPGCLPRGQPDAYSQQSERGGRPQLAA